MTRSGYCIVSSVGKFSKLTVTITNRDRSSLNVISLLLPLDRTSKYENPEINSYQCQLPTTLGGSGDLLDGICRVLRSCWHAGNARDRQLAKRCGRRASEQRQCNYRPDNL
jgi:hypothetical protein